MYANLPYTRVWVKQSFLQGPANFKLGKDPDMIEAYLIGVRATPYEPPLYEIYIPKYNACYDKVLQNAIFDREESPDREIDLPFVAWWDSISDNIFLYRKNMMTNCHVSMQNRHGESLGGKYLFTIDFNTPYHQSAIHMSESKFWQEHKSTNYFFDASTGVLCCGPNNKMRWFHSSLGTKNIERCPFQVFNPPADFTHEFKTGVEYTSDFDYGKEHKDET
jgi:hypothetical protein